MSAPHDPANATLSARRVFVASALFLFAELAIVRWTGSELHLLAFLKNLIIIAAFLGGGLGMVAGPRRTWLSWLALLVPVSALAIPVVGRSDRLAGLKFGDVGEFRWDVVQATGAGDLALGALFFALLFCISVLMFAGLGALIGRPLAALPGLRGYAWNLAGSLVGVILFAGCSMVELGPSWWLVILAPALGWAVAPSRVGVVVAALTIGAGLLGDRLAEPAYWSPYNRIAIRGWGAGDGGKPLGYDLTVNRSYFMTMLDLGRSTAGVPRLEDARRHYDLPYRFTAPRSVLVLGAGAGNDVAAALRAGARRVDAVEIDPRIVDLGRELHPERPYDSPAVRAIVDDARAWLRTTDATYDLIVFGLLDSHTLLAGLPGVRLDNYIYTREAFRDARRRLGPDGLMVVSFAVAPSHRWIGSKLFALVEAAFGAPPVVIDVGYDVALTFVAGPGLRSGQARLALAELAGRRLSSQPFRSDLDAGVAVPDDDWPHLYLRHHGIPTTQLVLLAVIGMCAFGLTQVVTRLATRPQPYFALLGAGFLLVETKGIADLGLLFGGTWWTVTSLFAAVLALSLLSVLFVRYLQPTTVGPYYAGLFLMLAVAYVVRPGMLLALSLPVAQVVGSLLFAAPVFFSGVVFAQAFDRTDDTARALGSNLLGAVMGGFLEYVSLVVGVRALSLVAMAVYGLSLAVLRRHR